MVRGIEKQDIFLDDADLKESSRPWDRRTPVRLLFSCIPRAASFFHDNSIFTKERTLLDMFASPHVFGGIGEALEILENHLGEIRIPKQVDEAIQYGVTSVSKRLTRWSGL